MYKQSLPLNNFINESIIADYQCVLCKGIFNIPVIDSCGHIFCNCCYQQYLLTQNQCPITSLELPHKPIHVTLIESIINNQLIKCSNHLIGCDWQGKVSELNHHITEECLKQTILCPFNECGLYFLREALNEHLFICDYREAKCVYCKMQMPFISIRNHDLICQKKILNCPQKCGKQIQRESMQFHLEGDCENKLINCPYISIGCLEQYSLKTLATHLDNHQDHHCDLLFEFYKKNINNQDDYMDYLNESITQIEKEIKAQKDKNQNALVKESMAMISIQGTKTKKIKKPLFVLNKAQNSSIYDMTYMPNEIEVNGSIIKCKVTNKTEHKYVFINMPMSYRNEIKWSIQMLSNSNWIGFGLCNKSRVIANNNIFYLPDPYFNHYSFAISSNGFLWNSNIKEENNIKGGFNSIVKDDVINFSYLPYKKELYFKINEYIGKLSNVYSIDEGEQLTPCIIILNFGDGVQVDIY